MFAKSMLAAALAAALAVGSAACSRQDATGSARVTSAADQRSARVETPSHPEPGSRAKAWPLLDGDGVGAGSGRRSRFVWDERVAMPEPPARQRDRIETDEEVEAREGDRGAAVTAPPAAERVAADDK